MNRIILILLGIMFIGCNPVSDETEVNTIVSEVDDLIITKSGVGQFSLWGAIENGYYNNGVFVRFEKLTLEGFGDSGIEYYKAYLNDSAYLTFSTAPSMKSKIPMEMITGIVVLHKSVRTKEGIGIGSTIGDLISAYPNYTLRIRKGLFGKEVIIYANGICFSFSFKGSIVTDNISVKCEDGSLSIDDLPLKTEISKMEVG